jgi:site-specific DNA recombinase
MANAKGLRCARSHFWKILRNPIYCGFISFREKDSGERQFIRGIHEPIVSEELFSEVQSIINSKRRFIQKKLVDNESLILHRYLICPACGRTLRGSFSQGRYKKYAYYHCSEGCKIRFNANLINSNYEKNIREFKLLPGVIGLFNMVLEDVNINTIREDHLREKRLLEKQIADQEFYMSRARKLFVLDKIKSEDFNNIRGEHQVVIVDLKDEWTKVTVKLNCIDKQLIKADKTFLKIFAGFESFDINDKKLIIDRIPPSSIDIQGAITLKANSALSKILTAKKQVKNIYTNI